MSSATEANNVFTDFREHTALPRTSSTATLTSILRNRYPSHHLTQINPSTCDLFSYASAGHAVCTLIPAAPSLFTTTYTPPAFRLDRKHNPGTLVDKPSFAAYTYTWTTTQFLVYKATLPGAYGQEETYIFLLAPLSDGAVTSTNHSTASDALLLAAGQWTQDLHEEILVFDSGMWRKDRELFTSVRAASWTDVILDPAMKNALIEDVEGFFDAQALYAEFGVPWKRGVILHGVPGNGKTISLKALMARLQAREEPVPSLYVKSLQGCQGVQHSVRAIFSRARRMAPCLLVLEDLDSLVTEEVRSYFLNEVDGLEANEGVLMVGSTNHLASLDPAIRDRPSRFDRKYEYRLPGPEEREAYARYWREKLGGSGRVAFAEEACAVIAELTDGFSFAYLKELFVAALLVIARGGKGEEMTVVEAGGSTTPESVVVVEVEADTAKEDAKEDSKGEKPSQELDAAEKELKEKEEKTRRRKEALAKVQIPESLQDDVLVRVIRQQIELLLGEMDNNIASGSKAKVAPNRGRKARLANIQRPTRCVQAVPMN